MRYFSIIFLFLFTASALPQDTSKTKSDELKHGVQFQIESLLQLRNYGGYAFSYRYLFNKNNGLRIGFYPIIRETDSEATMGTDNVTQNPHNSINEYYIKFSAHFLTNIITYNNFSLIIGGGPFYSFLNRKSYSEDNSVSLNRTSKSVTDGFTFGAELISGVEYRLAKNVIISGEYGLILQKEKSETKTDRKDIVESQTYIISEHSERDDLILSGSGVKLGLAVFF